MESTENQIIESYGEQCVPCKRFIFFHMNTNGHVLDKDKMLRNKK